MNLERRVYQRDWMRTYRQKHRDALNLKRREERAAHNSLVRAKERAYYARTPDQRRSASREWRERNRQAARATSLAWYYRNRDKMIAQMRHYREVNRERVAAYGRIYQKSHPEVYTLAVMRRATRKKGLTHTLTNEQWEAIKRIYKDRCAYCGKRAALAKDHLIPLSKGGPTTVSNIIPACKSCNSRKHVNSPKASQPLRLLLL